MFIEISESDFSSLVKAVERVNRDLQRQAGRKGRVIPYDMSGVGAVHGRVEGNAISVSGTEAPDGRLEFSSGRLEVSGPLFDGCVTAQDVARRIRETVLAEENVRNLRRDTVGCCEAVPVITFPDGRSPMVFIPEGRWDIENALLNLKESFIPRKLAEYGQFVGEIVSSYAGIDDIAARNTPRRSALLFDGRELHGIGEAKALSGEDLSAGRDFVPEVMKAVERYSEIAQMQLQEEAFGSNHDIDGLAFAEASFCVTGEGYSFIFRKEEGDGQMKPVFGVYVNTAGTISATDGRGWYAYPNPCRECYLGLQEKLNSGEEELRAEGLGMVRDILVGECLSEENIRKASEDVSRAARKSCEASVDRRPEGMKVR